MFIASRSLSSLILCAIASVAGAGEIERLTARLPDVEGPPRGEAQWVARSMRMNGLPMTIKSFQTRLPVDDVLNYYERSSRGKGSQRISRDRNGEWRVLGLHTQQHHVSIQVRATEDGSEGTITVTGDVKKEQRKAETKFPRPFGVELASLQEYDDLGIEAEHIDFTSRRSVSVEAQQFRSVLEREGWQFLIDGPAQKIRGGYVLEAQRGAEQARLVLQPGEAVGITTSIIVVWRKS